MSPMSTSESPRIAVDNISFAVRNPGNTRAAAISDRNLGLLAKNRGSMGSMSMSIQKDR